MADPILRAANPYRTAAIGAVVALAVVLTGPFYLDTYTVNILIRSLFPAALTMTAKQDRGKLRRNLLIGLSLFGAGLIGFSLSRFFPLSFALNLVVGFGMVLYGASTNTLVQSAVDDSYRGRVMSLYTLMFIGTAPLGSFVLGSVAQHFGAPWATRISGGLCVLGALWVFHRLRVLAREEPR